VKREERELDLQGVYRVAPDGKTLTVVEMTANTDFVTKNEEFRKLLNDLAGLCEALKIDSVDVLLRQRMNGRSVSEVVQELAGKIGENIAVKQVARVEGEFGYYVHHDGRQAAVVELSGATGEKAQALGKDLAMHVVFAKPKCVTREEVPAFAGGLGAVGDGRQPVLQGAWCVLDGTCGLR
jgi:elongation factor Ts